jgi:hypothetical protein
VDVRYRVHKIMRLVDDDDVVFEGEVEGFSG